MVFTKRVREAFVEDRFTCSIRTWNRPHVKVGNRCRMEEGEIVVDSIELIGFPDITPMLARESGFLGVSSTRSRSRSTEKGENIYLVPM